MDNGTLDAVFIILSSLSGVAGIIAASGWARAVNVRAEHARDERASRAASDTDPARDGAVLKELKALKQQMAEMHSTSHQFDISFDEALNRMNGRVGRLETKSAATTSTAADAPATLRNGLGQ